jgi:hypothetical protein
LIPSAPAWAGGKRYGVVEEAMNILRVVISNGLRVSVGWPEERERVRRKAREVDVVRRKRSRCGGEGG